MCARIPGLDVFYVTFFGEHYIAVILVVVGLAGLRAGRDDLVDEFLDGVAGGVCVGPWAIRGNIPRMARYRLSATVKLVGSSGGGCGKVCELAQLLARLGAEGE